MNNDNIEKTKIIRLFSFTEKQQKIFPFLMEYTNLINSWLIKNNFDDLQVLRYMLIGFFIDYRACCHHGNDFTTKIEKWTSLERRPETKEKLIYFNSLNGKAINSTREYIDYIKLGKFNKITGNHLFDYVISDKAISD